MGERDTAIDSQTVLEHLERILASDIFFSSRRLKSFLRFSVEKTLRGEADQLKEYTIGTEVFGRAASYDSKTDPIVRVEAGRLRSKLAQYYAAQGKDDLILIELPKGTYAPVFRPRETPKTETSEASWRRAGLLWPAVLACLTAAVFVSIYYIRRGFGRIPASVAVLPFVDLDRRPETEYLGDGLAEEVSNALARVRGLRVVAASSAFRLRGEQDARKIGVRLGVEAVLEGSITESAQKLWITAHLVSGADGHHLWSRAYDVEPARVFESEDDIVRQTARVLGIPEAETRAVRGRTRETQDAEAHDL